MTAMDVTGASAREANLLRASLRVTDVVTVLCDFSANRTPTLEHLANRIRRTAPDCSRNDETNPFSRSSDALAHPPTHSRICTLASFASTRLRVAVRPGNTSIIVEKSSPPLNRMAVWM